MQTRLIVLDMVELDVGLFIFRGTGILPVFDIGAGCQFILTSCTIHSQLAFYEQALRPVHKRVNCIVERASCPLLNR